MDAPLLLFLFLLTKTFFILTKMRRLLNIQ